MTRFNKLVVILTFLFTFSLLFYQNKIFASDIITPWTELISTPEYISNNYSFIKNGYLYSLGGANNSVPTTYVFSSVNTDGTINSWQNLSAQPSARYWHSGVQKDNFVYLFGGNDNTITNINSVISGKIESNGDILSWSSTTSLPETLSIGATEIVGDRVYYAGGVTDAHHMYETDQDTIYMATIDSSNGTIGNWTIAGHLNTTNFGMKIINIGNYLFEIGGYNNPGGDTFVRRALINVDGTIGSWENQPTLNHGIAMFGLVRVNDYIFVVGGDESGQINRVYYSHINLDNSISDWTTSSNNLPNFVGNNAVAVWGNRIYSIGGYRAPDGYQNNVYMTGFLGILPSSSPSPTPSPSPSPTPTPTPSPSLIASSQPTATAGSPTPLPIKKVFFAPGLGGSWNLDAIINCKSSNYSGTWQLAPFAKTVYQPFFDAIGLTNWKLNTFYYDWRNDVRSNGNLLNSFINSNTLPTEKVNFVGHSMGGLIGRSYMESNLGGKLNSYLSVGTPHKGVPYAYPTFSAGVIENNNLIEKIATTILVKHCGTPASVQNLLPTFDYLKDKKTGVVKPVSLMKAKNNYLPTNFSSPFWGVKVGTLSGTGFSTLKMYETNPPTLIDKLKGNWLDGKPIKHINDNAGDGTVLLTSSQLAGAQSNTIIQETHAGIIGATVGVNKILDFLGTPPVEDPPFIEPKSALVLIGSNGNFWIKDSKGETIQSDQGVITILNPKTEDFDFKYIPQNNNTLLIVAQFLPNGDVKYKEYKHRGYSPFSKKIRFNREHPREDICSDR